MSNNSSPDEVFLLNKIDDKQSGCSSGQESVGSSEISSSLSSTDSGTDNPRILTEDCNMCLSEVSKKPLDNMGYVTLPTEGITSIDSKVKSNLNGDYFAVGMNPNSSGGILMPEDTELNGETMGLSYINPEHDNKPYITVSNISKAVSNGYVPVTQDVNKDSRYVVAGNVNALRNIEHNTSLNSENKSPYIQISNFINDDNIKTEALQLPLQLNTNTVLKYSPDYISVGEIPSRIKEEVSSSYVPHRQFAVSDN